MWKCKKCGEENDENFEICWNCQNENDVVTTPKDSDEFLLHEAKNTANEPNASTQQNLNSDGQTHDSRLSKGTKSEKSVGLKALTVFCTSMIKFIKLIPFFGGIVENIIIYFQTLGKMLRSGTETGPEFITKDTLYDNEELKRSFKFLQVGILLSFILVAPYIFSWGEVIIVYVVLDLLGKAFLYMLFCHLFLIFVTLRNISLKKSIIVYSYVYGFALPMAYISQIINWHMFWIAIKDLDSVNNPFMGVLAINIILSIIIIPIVFGAIISWLSKAHDTSKKRVFFAVIVSAFPAAYVYAFIFLPSVSYFSKTLTKWLSYLL